MVIWRLCVWYGVTNGYLCFLVYSEVNADVLIPQVVVYIFIAEHLLILHNMVFQVKTPLLQEHLVIMDLVDLLLMELVLVEVALELLVEVEHESLALLRDVVGQVGPLLVVQVPVGDQLQPRLVLVLPVGVQRFLRFLDFQLTILERRVPPA